MREILFRGKTIKTGKWVEGLLWKKKYKSNKWFISCFPDKDDNEECFVVDPETVYQFTGLTDKNGVKIFEGDIVRWDDDDECISVIRYDIESAAFVIDEYGINGCLMEYGWDETAGGFGKIETNGFDDYSNLDFEVIGNIFDNPELMEGGGLDV